MKEEKMKEQEVACYAVGIVSLSCCALKSLSIDQIEKEVNLQHPSGVGPWHISEDETFKSGETIPHQCEDSEDREHWLLNC